MRKQIASTLLALAGLLPANAQLSFTVSVEYTGSCRGDLQKIADAWINQYKPQAMGIRTTQECEQLRQVVNGINYSNGSGRYSCGFKLKAGPCTGRPIATGAEAVGQVNIQGPEKGGSFFVTNAAVEIQSWVEDEAMRRMGLNRDVQYLESTIVSTGDQNYDTARNKLSGRMPDGSTKYIKNNDLLKVINLANRAPGVFTLSSSAMPITMIQPESGVYSPPIHDAYAEMMKEEEKRIQRQLELEQKEMELEQKEMKIWDEIKSKLDDVNYAQLEYMLLYNNGDKRPKFLGITDSGCYIFESEDGNNVFSVSKDAHDIQMLSFEEHSWNDDNIIKAIKEKSFKEVIDDRFEFEFKGGKLDFLDTKDGKITFGDLSNFSPDKLRQLLPYIKGEIKLKLFDNSSELSYEYMHLFDNHLSLGGKGTLSSGGKDDISASIKVDATGEKSKLFSDGKSYFSSSTSTVKDGISYGPIKIKGDAKAEIEITTAKLEGKGGFTKKVGNNYFYCSGDVEFKGGTKIDKNVFSLKPALKKSKSYAEVALSVFYVKGKIGGVQCKNITKYLIKHTKKNEKNSKTP